MKDNTQPPGHIPSLVAGIAPAVKAVSSQGGDILNNAIRQNVIDNVAKLKSATPILSAAVEDKKLEVVGGNYRLKDGKVVPSCKGSSKRLGASYTFAEMRESGVRGILVYCADYQCSHSIEISGDSWPDDVRLSDIEARFICEACGKRGADVRRDFNWDKKRVRVIGYR